MEPRDIARMKTDLGLMLADLRDAKGWSQQQLIDEGEVRTSRSTVANTETSRQFPDEKFWAECDQALDAEGELLAAYRQVNNAISVRKQHEAQAARARLSEQQSAWLIPNSLATSHSPDSLSEAPDGLLSRSALGDEIAEATRFASKIAAGAVASEMLEFTDLEIQRIAGSFGAISAPALAHDLGTLQRSVFALIERNRLPQQSRHLHLQAAQITGLMSHLLLDQGNYPGAESMTNVAWLCAQAAGHPDFLGWVRSVQSLIAYWNGDYPRAAALAADGMSQAENGTITVRLPGLLARAQGQMRNHEVTVEAIDAAERARTRLAENANVDDGLFTFPERKQASYASTALLSLGTSQDIPRAIEQSRRAIDLELERAGGRIASPDILAAYLDLTTAHLTSGDLDSADSTAQPVLDAPPRLRTASIRKRLGNLEAALSTKQYQRSPLALSMLQALTEERGRTAPSGTAEGQVMSSEHQSISDRAVIATSAYANDSNLRSRQRLYDFQTPVYDLPGMLLELLGDRSPEVVLDVGCGNGRYTSRFRQQFPDAAVIGIDIAPGMLFEVGEPAVVADVAQLPFASRSADVALAMHMLYHVQDVETGVQELARVIRQSGTVFASTNAIEDKAELDALWRRAAAQVLRDPNPPQRISLSRRFSLDDAPAILGRHFDSVTVHELPGTIRVTSPQPVIDHLASYESFARKSGIPFRETVKAAETLLQKHLDEHSEFTISCLGGILECRR
ncbi:hypothetical protein GCM10029992_36430 [Glycomyces albus]